MSDSNLKELLGVIVKSNGYVAVAQALAEHAAEQHKKWISCPLGSAGMAPFMQHTHETGRRVFEQATTDLKGELER